jgi:UDP-glucose 4-epimerase
MNIAVVTGGAGFIGSHVVDLLLAEGYRVHVVDNLVGGRLQNLDQHKDDSNLVVEVRDIREIEANDALFNDAQYVFHFAGIGDVVPSIERPVDYLSTNIMGTVRVLEGARAQASLCCLVFVLWDSRYAYARGRANSPAICVRAQQIYG